MICSAILTEYRRVTDGLTDRQTDKQTSCHGITGPDQLISHNFTHSQRSLIYFLVQRYLIQFSIDYNKKVFRLAQNQLCDFHNNSIYLKHLKSRFMGRHQTTYHQQGNKRVAKRLWGCVNAERQHWNTCCNFRCCKTCYYSDRNTV